MRIMSMLFCTLLLFSSLMCHGAELVRYWDFNGSPVSRDIGGNAFAPLTADKVVFHSGISGQALALHESEPVVFDAKGMFSRRGSVTFWVNADFSGVPAPGVQELLTLKTADGKSIQLVLAHIYEALLSCHIPTAEGDQQFDTGRFRVHDWRKGEWVHVAITWGSSNWASICLNGVPVEYKRFSGTDFSKVTQLVLGAREAFRGRIDELKIYSGPLSEEEVFKGYAQYTPCDAYVDQKMVIAGRSVTLKVSVAPLGILNGITIPVPGRVQPVTGDFSVTLEDSQGKQLVGKEWKSLGIRETFQLTLPEISLAEGDYQLKFTATAGGKILQKNFAVYAGNSSPLNSTSEELRLGEPVFTCEGSHFSSTVAFTDKQLEGRAYREGGKNKNDRLFCEFQLPENCRNGQLLSLEIQWPDDAPRAMGLYIYPPKGSKSEIRDRLGGGIYAGGAYPNSGKIQTTTYFFHGAFQNYLFEIRTMISGKPAGIARFTIRPVLGGLPKLKLNLPEGLPGRRIGHLDEDQSFDYNFDWDNARAALNDDRKADAKVVRMLMEYCAYTGQNLVSMPVSRYDWTNFQRTPYGDNRLGLVPFLGEYSYWIDQFQANGISFLPIINLYAPLELVNARHTLEYTRKGMITASVDGVCTGFNINNPIHPKNRELLLNHFDDLCARIGSKPGVAGIDFWAEWTIIAFRNLTFGYDDYTVNAFAEETKTKIPEAKDNLYRERYEFLTKTPGIRDKWIQWRTNKTTENIQALRKVMDRHMPDKPLYLTIRIPMGDKADQTIDSLDVEKFLYEEGGFDLNAIHQIPKVYVTPMRDSVLQIWHEHWSGADTVSDEALNNRNFTLPFKRAERNQTNNYRGYFESFSNSAMPEKYPSHFQNCELKPAGRYFLRELAVSLAFNDAQQIAVGAQPLFSLGREAEFREFAKAYRALPDLPFTDVSGALDPVTVRYCHTKNGTYLYAVGLIPTDSEVLLELNAMSVTDLSSGERLPVQNGKLRIPLKMFELRSFLIPGTVTPEFALCKVPEDYAGKIREKVSSLRGLLHLLADFGDKNSDATEKLDSCERLLAKGNFAEIERLLASKSLNSLKKKQVHAENGFLQEENAMLKRSHLRINCGSDEYVKTSAGLFLPDRKWTKDAPYGFIGTALTTERGVGAFPADSLTYQLGKQELYSISGYNFRAKPGKYTVRFYQRVGYEPSRKPDLWLINIAVNGKSLKKNYDIFKAEQADGMAVLELKNITPKNGVIAIQLSASQGNDSSIVLLNGIELIKE